MKSFMQTSNTRHMTIRLPLRLAEELQRRAEFEHNSASSVARRLLALGIAAEQEKRGDDA